MQTLIEMIRQANPTRDASSLRKRFYKILEELGEISEASNNLTNVLNGKGITWPDLREEIIDTLILTIDIALTPVKGNPDGVPLDTYDDRFPRQIFKTVLFEEELFEDSVFKINKAICTAREALTEEQYIATYFRSVFEMVSVSIVLTYTRFAYEEAIMFEDFEAAIISETRRKLDKWKAKRERMKAETGQDTDAL